MADVFNFLHLRVEGVADGDINCALISIYIMDAKHLLPDFLYQALYLRTITKLFYDSKMVPIEPSDYSGQDRSF